MNMEPRAVSDYLPDFSGYFESAEEYRKSVTTLFRLLRLVNMWDAYQKGLTDTFQGERPFLWATGAVWLGNMAGRFVKSASGMGRSLSSLDNATGGLVDAATMVAQASMIFAAFKAYPGGSSAPKF